MGRLASCVVKEDFLEERCLNCFLKNEKELIRRGVEKDSPGPGSA